MSKTIYYGVQFVTLHQKKPSDLPNASDTIYLRVGNVSTITSKYSLELGYGDPGENPLYDTFDYGEFKIAGISSTKPADYDSYGSYQVEAPSGGGRTITYRLYQSLSVPDDFVIPGDLGTAAQVQKGVWALDPLAAQVGRLYDTVFHRHADPVGLDGWMHALRTAASMADVVAAFLGAPEFQAA